MYFQLRAPFQLSLLGSPESWVEGGKKAVSPTARSLGSVAQQTPVTMTGTGSTSGPAKIPPLGRIWTCWRRGIRPSVI